MNDRTANGFVLSTALHVVVAALLLFGYFVGEQETKPPPRVLELVAGEGDNYAATEAPALGTPDGIKLRIPEIAGPPVPLPMMPAPESEPTPPSPVQAAPEPPAPAPEPVVERAPVTKPTKATTEAKPAPEEKIRDFSKDVSRISRKRQARLEAKYKAQREAEERRAKEQELRNKRMTKAEFDAQNRREASARKSGGGTGAKVTRIDAEGIAKGVVGGSANNKIGGAGGKALTREEGDELDAYFAYLKRRLHEALDKPPGLSDSLVAVAEMRIAADGTLSGARIVRSSGSAEFDEASLEAISRVRSIGPRPDGKAETIRLSFKMREEDDD